MIRRRRPGSQRLRAAFAPLYVICILLVPLGAVDSWCQGTSTITGTVRDASRAAIPVAQVAVTSKATSRRRETVSGHYGGYRFTNLVPGDYEVSASSPGFRTSVALVEVTVGDVVHLDLVLEPGGSNVKVVVTDAASTVELEQGRLSALVDKRRLSELPLNGRNVYQLMQLTPGAVDTRATIFEPGQGANVNGGRANSNGFWMDGITAKGLSGGAGAEGASLRQMAGMQPNLESIQEFRIETTNFSAEFGNSSASIVSVASKSGTNEFHGSLHAFHRNDNLDAREFFDQEKPEFKQNQFGFSLGGPVLRDRSFFFGSYEGTRIRTGETRLGTFESRDWAGFVAAHGAPVARFLHSRYLAPAVRTTHQTVGQYLVEQGYVDSPDQESVNAFLAETFAAPGAIRADSPMIGETAFFVPDSTDSDGFSLRIDHDAGKRDKLFGRYFLNEARGVNLRPRPEFNSSFLSKSHLLALGWTHILSPTIVNEARAGLTRNLSDDLPVLAGVPGILDADGVSEFGGTSGLIFHENIFSWADTLSITLGRHGLKMGGEVRRNQENSELGGDPIYVFFDLISLALDDPGVQGAGVDPKLDEGPGAAEVASNSRGWRSSEIGLFFNDDWKVRTNLTLNIGIRWDWHGRLQEVQNRATAFDLSRGGNTIFERVANGAFIGPVDKLSEDDWNNVSPRVGLAWDPRGSGRMSVRAGYGIAYQSAIFNPLSNSRWNKPFYSVNRVFPLIGLGERILYGPQDGSSVRVDGRNPNPGASRLEGNIIAYDGTSPNLGSVTGIVNPGMRDPYVQSFFFGVQRELFRDTTFEFNYVGTLGRKLFRAESFNRFPGDLLGAPSPVTGDHGGDTNLNGINPNEGVLRFWENSVNSNYHAMQLLFARRHSQGFAINAHYTLAKSLDSRSSWHNSGTTANLRQEGFSTDVTNVALDYGRSIFDARHRLVTSWLWEIPGFDRSGSDFWSRISGGWQLNGIAALQSGQPFTPYTNSAFPGGDFNADGERNDRPNTPAAGNSLSSQRSDFVNPSSGVFNIPDIPGLSPLADRLAFFGRPQPGTNGNLGRNTYEGPGFAGVDFSILKEFGLPTRDEARLQIRIEFFNLFNRVNFQQPEPRIERATFGRATQAFDAREIQFGIKLLF